MQLNDLSHDELLTELLTKSVMLKPDFSTTDHQLAETGFYRLSKGY